MKTKFVKIIMFGVMVINARPAKSSTACMLAYNYLIEASASLLAQHASYADSTYITHTRRGWIEGMRAASDRQTCYRNGAGLELWNSQVQSYIGAYQAQAAAAAQVAAEQEAAAQAAAAQAAAAQAAAAQAAAAQAAATQEQEPVSPSTSGGASLNEDEFELGEDFAPSNRILYLENY